MIKGKSIILCCWLLALAATNSYAQSGTVAAGGDDAGTNGKISYSIGQIDYETSNSSAGTITEGLQQPYEIVVISVTEAPGITLEASVYPNPTEGLITLNTGDRDFKNMSYGLFDTQGKLIARHALSKKETVIQMGELARGAYFIKVLDDKTEVEIFKVIKNN